MSAAGMLSWSDFPSFSEGLSLRRNPRQAVGFHRVEFPFLFGGTFIEAVWNPVAAIIGVNFPSFSEGLSLRPAQPSSN